MIRPKRYAAVYEKRGRWYVGYSPDVPGANTQGRTLREARSNLREAIDLILMDRRSARRATPPTRVLRESILVSAR